MGLTATHYLYNQYLRFKKGRAAAAPSDAGAAADSNSKRGAAGGNCDRDWSSASYIVRSDGDALDSLDASTAIKANGIELSAVQIEPRHDLHHLNGGGASASISESHGGPPWKEQGLHPRGHASQAAQRQGTGLDLDGNGEATPASGELARQGLGQEPLDGPGPEGGLRGEARSADGQWRYGPYYGSLFVDPDRAPGHRTPS